MSLQDKIYEQQKNKLKKRKYADMTIRTRLTISNFMMLFIPLVVSAVIATVSFLLVWVWTTKESRPILRDNKEYTQKCQEYVADIKNVLSGESSKKLGEIGLQLSQEYIGLLIIKNDEEYYSNHQEDLIDRRFGAELEESSSAYISIDDKEIYVETMNVSNDTYEIFIFANQTKATYHRLAMITWVAVGLLVVMFLLLIHFVNLFLTRFISLRLEESMNILTDGVGQIREGNLAYRIDYPYKDEFQKVCEDFNEMAHRLQESSEMNYKQVENRKKLIADISHDLRSPLTSINAYTDGLIDGVARDEEAKIKYLHRIKEKTNDLINLVSKLFLYSKMDLEEYPVHPEILLLDNEVKEFINAIADDYLEKGLEVDTHLYIKRDCADDKPMQIYADSEQLRYVLSNILDNCWKYKKKDVGHVCFYLEEREKTYLLKIEDDGPGVSEEFLPYIFEVFYREDPARNNPGGGSGLGMAIVMNAVKRMKGTVKAENLSPSGLSIQIILPVYQ